MSCPYSSMMHTIRRGETLYGLAVRYRVSVRDLLELNPGIRPNSLRPGQPVCIPLRMHPAAGLRDEWRSLWEQHVAWTRMTILGALYGSPDLHETLNRLLRNASDMAAIIRRYYGPAAASRFEELVRQHLLIAVDLVNAAKAGDAEAAGAAERRWYANAVDIASLLAGLDPFWSQETFRPMLFEHLALTKAEAVAILGGEFQRSVELYDTIEKQALGMADELSSGMSRQFE
jgi:LysM repeat protein